MANQSMLMGNSWEIGSLNVLRDEDDIAVHPRPSGLVTFLYAAHHGDRLLESTLEGSPSYVQPLRMGDISHDIHPNTNVAYLDVVVTSDERSAYVHVINRHPSDDLSLAIAWPAGSNRGPLQLVRHVVTGDPTTAWNQPGLDIQSEDMGRFDGTVMVPSHSVSVLVLTPAE